MKKRMKKGMKKVGTMKRNEIKAVAFDIGGVLYEENPHKHHKELSDFFGIDFSKLKKKWTRHLRHASRGHISPDDYFRLVYSKTGLKNFRFFRKKWIELRAKRLVLDKAVEKIIMGLKGKYVLASFTNIIRAHNPIRVRHGVYRHFDLNVISCREGMRKPEPRFYRLLLKRLKLAPDEIVFIDDFPKNLVPAKRLGMRVILFRNARQLKRDLKRAGVKI